MSASRALPGRASRFDLGDLPSGRAPSASRSNATSAGPYQAAAPVCSGGRLEGLTSPMGNLGANRSVSVVETEALGGIDEGRRRCRVPARYGRRRYDDIAHLRPGRASRIGGHRRADDVVTALHDGARQPADAVELCPRPILVHERAVGENGAPRCAMARARNRHGRFRTAPAQSDRVEHGPRGGSRRAPPGDGCRVAVDQASIVVARMSPRSLASGARRSRATLRKDRPHAVQEPVDLRPRAEEDAAQDEAAHALRVLDPVGQRQRAAPRAAEQQPLTDPEMEVSASPCRPPDGRWCCPVIRRAASIDRSRAGRRRRCGRIADRRTPMNRCRARARPAMKEHHGHAGRIAALLPVDRVPPIDSASMPLAYGGSRGRDRNEGEFLIEAW